MQKTLKKKVETVGPKKSNKILPLSFPSELVRQAERLAKKEGRTKSELFGEAMRRYISAEEWRELQAFGSRQAKKLGIHEEDIPRIVREFRQGR